MEEELNAMAVGGSEEGQRSGRFLGSLKDALVAASRDNTGPTVVPVPAAVPAEAAASPEPSSTQIVRKDVAPSPSAAEAAREVRARTQTDDRHVEMDAPPTTRVVRSAGSSDKSKAASSGPARTSLVRGKMQVKRGAFDQDPVVGWLVIVGGPGIGQYRPVFEGNNTMGRAESNRIAIDFGDDAISAEEQAYIRYDSGERSFLFVPNLAKTNVVSVNDKRPTGAVELGQMDVITMGRTQLVFVPFCGADFDWSALSET
jgi:FHA domain